MSKGPGTNTGHGYVWERPDGQRANCGGTAVCLDCAKDHARWGKAISSSMKLTGVISKDEPQNKNYVEAPPAVRAAAESLVLAIINDLRTESGEAVHHKAVLLHRSLMQAQNAVFRVSDRMSVGGYVDGVANYVAQALAIGPSERAQQQFDDFMKILPELYAKAREAGWGAGISNDGMKGSA